MSARDELLDSLLAERYDNRWWKTPPVDDQADDDLTIARRRRHMAADYDQLNALERTAGERPESGA
jgi:hypothetical protein